MATLVRDTFCSYCGTAYDTSEGPQSAGGAKTALAYPRTCRGCKTQIWANPIPVSVVLVPVLKGDKTGLLVVRRSIEPKKGLLALVGGFLEEHETWAVGGAREIREETGVEIDPETLTPMWFTSTAPRPNRVLLFSVAKALDVSALGKFTPSNETSERGVVFGPEGLDQIFAFPLHVEAAKRFFDECGIDGPHGYIVA